MFILSLEFGFLLFDQHTQGNIFNFVLNLLRCVSEITYDEILLFWRRPCVPTQVIFNDSFREGFDLCQVVFNYTIHGTFRFTLFFVIPSTLNNVVSNSINK